MTSRKIADRTTGRRAGGGRAWQVQLEPNCLKGSFVVTSADPSDAENPLESLLGDAHLLAPDQLSAAIARGLGS